LNLLSTTFPETLNAAEPAYQLQLFQEHTDDADFQAFDDVVAMRDIAQRLGSKFLVILTPTEVELFRKDFDGIAMRVRSFSQREGIAFADPLPILRNHPDKLDLYIDGLPFSARGHAVMAEWLVPQVRSALGL
jgi:hypothetical protein